MALQRSRIRSDAKLASGMGLEAAGQRIPGFNRDHIPVGLRLTGFRGQTWERTALFPVGGGTPWEP
eukprot:14848682-Heterocapsa_arctica.AAC.1